MSENMTFIDIDPESDRSTQTASEVGGIILRRGHIDSAALDDKGLYNKFLVDSEDHHLITASLDGHNVDGTLGFSLTRGAGFGVRGQIANLEVPEGDESGQIKKSMLDSMMDLAKKRGLANLYLQEDDPVDIQLHLDRGAVILEKEMTLRYNTNESIQIVGKDPVELPEGYSIGLTNEYDKVEAVGIAALMRQLDPTFTSVLTPDRVKNYQHMIDSPDYEILTVRNANGNVVGSLSLTKTDVKSWQLEDVILDEDERGKGLGKAMIITMIQEAENADIEQIFLQTEAERPEAVSLYTSTGAVLLEGLKTMEYKTAA